MDTDSDAIPTDQLHTNSPAEDWALFELEQDQTTTDVDQAFSEDQTYRDTIRGIKSFMGWKHIPDMHTAISNADDNPPLPGLNSTNRKDLCELTNRRLVL